MINLKKKKVLMILSLLLIGVIILFNLKNQAINNSSMVNNKKFSTKESNSSNNLKQTMGKSSLINFKKSKSIEKISVRDENSAMFYSKMKYSNTYLEKAISSLIKELFPNDLQDVEYMDDFKSECSNTNTKIFKVNNVGFALVREFTSDSNMSKEYFNDDYNDLTKGKAKGYLYDISEISVEPSNLKTLEDIENLFSSKTNLVPNKISMINTCVKDSSIQGELLYELSTDDKKYYIPITGEEIFDEKPQLIVAEFDKDFFSTDNKKLNLARTSNDKEQLETLLMSYDDQVASEAFFNLSHNVEDRNKLYDYAIDLRNQFPDSEDVKSRICNFDYENFQQYCME